MGGSFSIGTPGGTLRRMTTLMASRSTGSMSSDTPSSCTSQLAWPSQVRRAPSPGAGGVASAARSGSTRRHGRAWRGLAAPARELVPHGPLEDVVEGVRPAAIQVLEARHARVLFRAPPGTQGASGQLCAHPGHGGTVRCERRQAPSFEC